MSQVQRPNHYTTEPLVSVEKVYQFSDMYQLTGTYFDMWKVFAVYLRVTASYLILNQNVLHWMTAVLWDVARWHITSLNQILVPSSSVCMYVCGFVRWLLRFFVSLTCTWLYFGLVASVYKITDWKFRNNPYFVEWDVKFCCLSFSLHWIVYIQSKVNIILAH